MSPELSSEESLEASQVTGAVKNGCGWRLPSQREPPGVGLLAHSDRGVQYASEHYQRHLDKHDITCSMSWKANFRVNPPMESLFDTLKKRTRSSRGLQDPGTGTPKPVRVHRGYLQLRLFALRAGLPLTASV